jgi:hypothetical protein
LLGLLAAGAAWLTWPHGPAAQEAPPTTRDASPRYVGVSGCAAAACHGGNGPREAKGSEYSTWAGLDRHPNAFAVLYDKRSVQMVRLLYGKEAPPATKQPLCLKCHATDDGGLSDDGKPKGNTGDRFAAADGVGCESCHGAAGGWVSTHYQSTWAGLSPEQRSARRKQLGMTDTTDLLVRVRVCTQCHVGTADKDVNHDLIAAGHPRLNFEFASFHAIYPKHWPQGPERQRYPDLHARLWQLGQVVTAEAATDLLVARAEGAKDAKKPWPEFAEYACYACHKSLKEDSPRQKAGYAGRRPGDFPWGTWYITLTRAYAKQPGGPGQALDGRIDALRKRMEQPGPAAAEVAEEARAVAAALKGWAATIHASRPQGADQVRRLLEAFAREGERRGDELDWDEAAQFFLSLAALNQGLGDLSGGQSPAGVTADLVRMRQKLQGAFPPRFDSPLWFNPLREPSLRALFRGVREQLPPQ